MGEIMNHDISVMIKNFNKNNITSYFVNYKKELLDLLLTFIKDGTSVGCGDSVTLEQMGVFDFLRDRELIFLDKFNPSLTREEKRDIYLKNFTVDTFITGTNAVTLDGKIFNIDGNGSRVAPILYGPKQVIIVIGTNKIVADEDSAIKRVRQIAAPLDAKRLGKNTPCVSLNRCIDCNHNERICNDFVLITGQFIKDRIKLIIVNQELGY